MENWKRWLRANSDRAGAWACVAVGVIFLLAGWYGVSHTAYPAEQLPYIVSGGIGGALVVAFGAALLISADLRDEWRKLDRIEHRLAEMSDAQQSPSTSSRGGGDGGDAASPAEAGETDAADDGDEELAREPTAEVATAEVAPADVEAGDAKPRRKPRAGAGNRAASAPASAGRRR